MRKPRVIIIDDDTPILKLLKTFLSRRNYEVITCNNPAACQVYENHTGSCNKQNLCSDILITDFKMPRMSGIELLHKQFIRDCKLDKKNKAVISGQIDNENKKTINKLGCTF
jgi:CheY-like chemotaxis protein